jgi:hypothetical protein
MNFKRFTLLLAALSVGNSVDAASKVSKTPWGGAWGYATSPAINVARDVLPGGTYRYRLRSSQSGDGLRLTFTNPEGAVPLDIGRVTVARAAGEDGFALLAATERPITFAAGQTVRITGGGTLTSLPVDAVVTAGDDLIVTLETRRLVAMQVFHWRSARRLCRQTGPGCKPAGCGRSSRSLPCGIPLHPVQS